MVATHGGSDTRDDVVESSRPVAVRYRTYLPRGPQTAPLPLLIYLHGSGETGTDLDRLERAGLPRLLRAGLSVPFRVVCPQCTEQWNAEELALLLEQLLARDDVDRSRVYVCGVSLGGLGTWSFANLVAPRLAAIVPICAPAVRIDAQRFVDLPVYCVHGVMDSVVPVTESVRMVRALRKAGCNVTFRVHADVDHDVWDHCLNDELWNWLLARHRRA